MYKDFDLKKVQAAWEKYVAGPEDIPDEVDGVRPEILASWRRSKGKADPFAPMLHSKSEEELKEAEKKNALLIYIAYPYMLDFYKQLEGMHCQVTLADRDGCQLRRIATDEKLLTLSQQKLLTNGCMFDEADTGTNGIGTCLATESPVQIIGPEHFHKMYSNIICYATPIHDPNQKIIGCINIICLLDEGDPLLLNLLETAANGIEQEFRLTKVNNMLHAVLEYVDSGILLLDADQNIIEYNNNALEILKVDGDLKGCRINSIIQEDSLPEPLKGLKQEVSNTECTILNKNHQALDVSVSVKFSADIDLSLGTTLLILQTQKYVHSIANRLTGYAPRYTFDSIMGNSASIRGIKSLGQVAAGSDSPVLLSGEIGTGKEVMAQAIHNASSRAKAPFITIHCDKIPKDLIESELFGLEGGTANGDISEGYPGKLELANGGTLLLDEISALPLDIQTSFYDACKSGKITRLGGRISKDIDVKIIAATSENLMNAVQNGMFRSDLYYYLSIMNITIPPLREHTEDIPVIVKTFSDKYSKVLNHSAPIFDDDCMQVLVSYNWPENVRELERVIEQIIYDQRGPVIQISDLPANLVNHYYASLRSNTANRPASGGRYKDDSVTISEAAQALLPQEVQERNLLINAMKETRGKVKVAAEQLSIPASTLYRKLAKYHLEPKAFRQAALNNNSPSSSGESGEGITDSRR
jgi:transcriptional regulator of acetoin/glycerol metabolism